MAKIIEKNGIIVYVWQKSYQNDGMTSDIWHNLKKVMAEFFKIF